jgi:hypothetical protein
MLKATAVTQIAMADPMWLFRIETPPGAPGGNASFKRQLGQSEARSRCCDTSRPMAKDHGSVATNVGGVLVIVN